MQKPSVKPDNPCFSSGPCAKRPGWDVAALDAAATAGRSHRSGIGKKKLKEVIDLHREILRIPDDYLVGIVPASDTGAVEMAMWAMLGARGVESLAWENFSGDWLKDIKNELKLSDVNYFEADYGEIVDLSEVDTKTRDVVFAWNGTTSGVRVPNGDWIAADREGVTICDATSAVFAYDMPWDKLDVTTWSWQKVLGSEAAHGMMVLSPRAVERLETYDCGRPLPKIFRMVKGGKINQGIFVGETINTPSMLAVADVLDALHWVKEIGGLSATQDRALQNYTAIADWVEQTPWAEFLCEDEQYRSLTSVCIKIDDDWFNGLGSVEAQQEKINQICKMLEAEDAAYDLKNYKTAPPGFRLWCGATVERKNVEAVLPWLEWGFAEVKKG